MEKAGLVTMSLSISLLSSVKTKLGRERKKGSREEASMDATNFTFLSQHALHEAKAGMNDSTALMQTERTARKS